MKVTLSSGIIVDVQSVPPMAVLAVQRKYRGQDNADQLISDALWLIALPDIEIPNDWSIPIGLAHAGIEPRGGEYGHLIDYIEYGLLKTSSDVNRVRSVMYDSPDDEEITDEEIEDSVATFQN